jgi:hypothetical protein
MLSGQPHTQATSPPEKKTSGTTEQEAQSTPKPLVPTEHETWPTPKPLVPTEWRHSQHQNQSGHFREEKNLFTLPGIKPPDHPVNITDWMQG